MSQAKSAEKVVQEIRRKTRRQFSAEEKIRIVLEGLRGKESIAALCRREGLNPNLYYRWKTSRLARSRRVHRRARASARGGEMERIRAHHRLGATVEPVTSRCGTRRVCQARSSGSERYTRARPHAVAPMNCVPEDSRRRSTCTGRTHAPRARADGNQTPSSTVAVRAPSPS